MHNHQIAGGETKELGLKDADRDSLGRSGGRQPDQSRIASPRWRVQLLINVDSTQTIDLDLHAPLTLGRDLENSDPEFVGLNYASDEGLTVSRQHLELRPTSHGLFAVDLGSTNGTSVNGVQLEPRKPTPIVSGDLLTLGLLQISLNVLEAPPQGVDSLLEESSPNDDSAEISRHVTSQIELEDVLAAAIDRTVALTGAREVMVWLYEPAKAELCLKAVSTQDNSLDPNMRIELDSSLLGEVAITHEPVRVGDDSTDRMIAIGENLILHSALLVPLSVHGKSQGVLVAGNRQRGHSFTAEHLARMVALGDFVAVAIENARLNELSNERTAELEALRRVGVTMTSSLNLETVLSTVLESTLGLPGTAREAQVFLLQGDRLVSGLALAEGEQTTRPVPVPTEDSLAFTVARQGQLMVLRDIQSGSTGEDVTPFWEGSIVGLPLKVEERVVGVMVVSCKRSPQSILESDVRILNLLGTQAAVAIENARLYEELTAAYDTVEAADQLKGEMIANLSHEFRTPLSYIVGYVALLSEQGMDTGSLTGEQQHSLQQVASSAERLRWLLEKLMTLQAIEESVLNEMEATDLVDLVDGLVSNMRLQAETAQIELLYRKETDIPTLMLQRMSITQVIENLLSNAIKFTPKGGEVVVSTWEDRSVDAILVSVKDTGIGISEDQHERIFDRFYQVDGSASRQFDGLGIGLALCKEVVEAHGGTIWVDSSPGEGATFTVALPIGNAVREGGFFS